MMRTNCAELRPTDDADKLRIPRRRGLAEAQPYGVAAGLGNGEDEAWRIEAVHRELVGAVFARRKHAPRGGDREHPDCRINVAGNCRPGRGAVDEPAFSGLAAEDGGLLVGGELDARDPLHRE